MIIQFTVYGNPVAQGRPKFTTHGGFSRAYDPKNSKDYKDYVKLVGSEHAPEKLLLGEIGLLVNIYRPIPKSFSKKKAALAEAGKIRPITKPDTDNYIKGIKDALKSVIWKDDSQVVDEFARKWYSDRPRIEVRIKDLTQS